MIETRLVRAYEFGLFRFDVPNRLLTHAGVGVAMKPKVASTLLLLLENHGRVVTKEQLMRALWPDRFVEEANLTQNIYALRSALDERDQSTAYVETIARRGYRFVGGVRTVADEATPRSIAVLPFAWLRDDGTDESLALGVADALITTLGNSGLVIVRPISASRRYAGLQIDPIDAARELAVDAVLHGSIQRSGDTIRVTARLIRAADGATLWSGRYHEAMTGIFEVQDSIADKITAALAVARSGAASARLAKRYTSNVEAYQLYLNGRYHWNRSTEEGLRTAIGYFARAIALDPQFALAYVGTADAYTALDWYGVLSTRDSNPHAFAAAQEALRIDPELAEAHASLAIARQYRWDWSGAEESFLHSISLNPHYAFARLWFGLHLAFRGRFDEAVAQVSRAQELDPLSLTVRAQLVLSLYCARRYDEALHHCRMILAAEPGHDEALIYLALTLVQTNAPDAALVELRKSALLSTPDVMAMQAIALAAAGRAAESRALIDTLTLRPTYIPRFWIAAAQVALGDTDAALQSLEAACDDPDDSLAGIGVVPLLDPLRSHPRFNAVLRRMGLGM